VWRAAFQELPRPVDFAVKQMQLPSGVDPAEWPSPEQIRRWHEQLKLLQAVRHPHIVSYKELFVGWPPHGIGEAVGEPPQERRTWYVVMDYVSGPDLHELVMAGELDLEAKLDLISQLAEAVDHLHSGCDTNGMTLLHRDIKPANVVVAPDRGAVLVDCGLLRVAEPVLTELPAWTGPYLAPEVHADKTRASVASDVWAVAATAFFALVGEHPSPFEPDLMAQQLDSALAGQLSHPELVVEIFMEVLGQPPDHRPVSATIWAGRLRAATGRAEPAASTGHAFRWPILLASLIAALAALGVLLAVRDSGTTAKRAGSADAAPTTPTKPTTPPAPTAPHGPPDSDVIDWRPFVHFKLAPLLDPVAVPKGWAVVDATVDSGKDSGDCPNADLTYSPADTPYLELDEYAPDCPDDPVANSKPFLAGTYRGRVHVASDETDGWVYVGRTLVDFYTDLPPNAVAVILSHMQRLDPFHPPSSSG
jgi:serine/threonine protein kinase